MRGSLSGRIALIALCAATTTFAQHGVGHAGSMEHGMAGRGGLGFTAPARVGAGNYGGSIYSPGLAVSPVTASFPNFNLRNYVPGGGYTYSRYRFGGYGYRGGFRYFRGRNYLYGYWGLPYYPLFWDSGDTYFAGQNGAQAQQNAAAMSDQVTANMLGEQVQRLSDEIEQLRDQQRSGTAAEPSAGEQPDDDGPSQPPVTLVLKSGQQFVVQNYAVMGDTFWDFSRQPARKIPIRAINIAASAKATAVNGGEFPQLGSGS